MDNNFDILIIGGGAAGLFAVSAAINQKAKVCLIEKRALGGDCTWYGCIPSKTLIKSAIVADLIKQRKNYGLGGNIDLETAKVMEHVRKVRDEIAVHETSDVLEKRGIKVIIGSPRFIASCVVEVNQEKITAKKFIICTGSHPVILPIEGLKDIDYLTNETIFELKELPKSLIVLGGGPIGLELSQSLHRLGVEVTVVEMMDKILWREDPEVAEFLEKKLRQEGLNVLTGKKAIKFERKNQAVIATLEDSRGKKEQIQAENVLVAIGRAPNIEELSLETADVNYTKKSIAVNNYLQTTNKNIFACGDVVGPYQFSHVAAYQAYVCVRNTMFRKIARTKVNYSNVPWATFTDPELARVGVTETEAKEKDKNIKVYKTEYSSSDRAITDRQKEGLVKIITNKKGMLLGAHIVGASAGEIIQGFLIAKSLNIPISKLGQILFIYPTLSELVKKTAAKPLVESLQNPFIKLLLKIIRKS